MKRARNRVSLWDRIKKYLWRITGVYCWIVFVSWLFGDDSWLVGTRAFFFRWLMSHLTAVGLAPRSPGRLFFVVKVCWVLVVSEFKFWHVVGLVLYIFSFPFLMLSVYTFRGVLKSAAPYAFAEQKPPGLGVRRRTWPLVTVSICGLVCWYSLYGDATTVRAAMPGVVFSLCLFLLLGYRAFQRVKPTSFADAFVLNRVESTLLTFVSGMENSFDENMKKPKSAIVGALWTYKWQRKLSVWTGAFLRGKRGRDRVSMIILLEFVFSLLVLGASAVIFWGILIRCIAMPVLSLSRGVLVAAEHFVPNFQVPPLGATIPMWANLGASVTAVILFVIYVAAVASILPGKQQGYVERTSLAYARIRTATVSFGRRYRELNRRPNS